MKKGKYPDGVEIPFCSGINLFDVKDFERNLADGDLIWNEFKVERSVLHAFLKLQFFLFPFLMQNGYRLSLESLMTDFVYIWKCIWNIFQ